ncbi:MAG TPA: hypothetical protein VLB83_04120 [Candidatus Paceibacterota bacterium]|nr:hypothetical protein [Candidatus Paceibacterota bacterium]
MIQIDLCCARRSSRSRERGYVLLLSVLVSSVLLSVSLGVFLIGLREIKLASFQHESLRALAAADSAVECALYWDRAYPQNGLSQSIFATSSDFLVDPALATTANCYNTFFVSDPASNWNVSTLPDSGDTTFTLELGADTCAEISVNKDFGDTTIRGDGSSTCDTGNLYSTQRSIEVFSNI